MTTTVKGIEIKEEVLATYGCPAKSGLGFETVGMIKLEGLAYDLKLITDFIRANFLVHKDSVMKWGEHEIHIWTSEDGRAVHITPNGEKNGEERNREITSRIRQELTTTFKDLEVLAIFGKGYQLTKEKIEEFLFSFKIFDLSQIPFEKFNVIQPTYAGYPKPSTEAMEKFRELNHNFKQMMLDRKAVVNGMKGTFKRVSNGDIGFFKQRVRKSYYNFELNDIRTLEFY